MGLQYVGPRSAVQGTRRPGSLCEVLSKGEMTKFAFLKSSPDGSELLAKRGESGSRRLVGVLQ